MNKMLRNRIACDLKNLDDLNKIYPWIPNSISIRPKPIDIEKKKILSMEIQSDWNTYSDYILHVIFGYKYYVNDYGKKITPINNFSPSCNQNKWVFAPSMFRYNIIPESNHWILWCLEKDFSFDFPDELINQIIEEKIKFVLDLESNIDFQFAWYKNPKPTIPEFYHVQVFWICSFHNNN